MWWMLNIRHVSSGVVSKRTITTFACTVPELIHPRGNLAQLGLAIARTFAPDQYRTYGFQLPDIQALVSLLSFLVGASLGRFEVLFGGGKRKSWLVTATFVQCLLAAAAAIAHHYSGEVGVAMYVTLRLYEGS